MIGEGAQRPGDETARSAAVCAQPAERGFTLVELLVTISVMAILLAIGVPYFGDATLGSKLRSYANSLAASAYLARSEAIKRNTTVSLCAGASCPGAGGWEQGWVVQAADGTLIQSQQALASGLKINGNASSIDFPATGVRPPTSAAVILTVCRATPPSNQERWVTISTTGRPSVSKTPVTGAPSCP